MTQKTAELVCMRVSQAIKTLDDLYVVIVIKQSGLREVVIRKKEDYQK
jgi:hypothetical protein